MRRANSSVLIVGKYPCMAEIEMLIRNILVSPIILETNSLSGMMEICEVYQVQLVLILSLKNETDRDNVVKGDIKIILPGEYAKEDGIFRACFPGTKNLNVMNFFYCSSLKELADLLLYTLNCP